MDSDLTNVMYQDIELNSFSEFAKVASVKPLYKKEDKSVTIDHQQFK